MEKKTPLSRREMNKLDRRQAIVDAARRSFLEHGYAGTSMSGLLKILGGSKATLWRYFRSKEELFGAVVEDISASFRADLDEPALMAAPLEAALVRFCKAMLRSLESPDAHATWRLVVGESGRSPEVGKAFYEHAPQLTERSLQRLFARHVAEGNLIDADPERMAQVLTSLCIGRQNRRIWSVEAIDSNTHAADSVEFARIFLAAYAARRD